MKKEQSEKTSLVKKLIDIRAQLGPVKKEHRNPHFGYNYVSEGQIMALLEPYFTKYRILYTTSVETQDVRYGEPKEGVFVAVTTVHTFTDADTGEKIVLKGAGVGWDSGDKGSYKAQTGATKYNLTKNFMVSDEQEPESGEQAPAGKPAGAQGHRRTRAYEEETGEGDTKVAGDLIELKSFLTQHKIPDGFLLRLLQEKKLIDGHTKNVAQLKPGVLRRVLSPKSLDNLKKAWVQQQADDDIGGETVPPYKGKATSPASDENEEHPEPPAKAKKEKHPFDSGTPDRKPLGDEVRTKEGDQTRGRQPATDDIAPRDMLEQEGYDDWREVEVHFGKDKGTLLGKMPQKKLAWWINSWTPEPYKGTWQNNDLVLDAALVLANEELGGIQ